MIDTHIHLDDERYIGQVDDIVNSFEKDKIDFVINAAAEYAGMVTGFVLAQKYPKVYCTVGCHPHDAKTFDNRYALKMAEFSANPKVVAVGEIGLDYYYELSDKATQKDIFAYQIELADRAKLPICLHIRDAFGDCLDVLNALQVHLNSGVLFHCYSGSAEMAKQLAKKGYYFSFGGAVTFKKNRKSEVLQNIPITQIVTETDGPYLTPEPYRGKLNYPKYISYVLPVLAESYGVTVEKMEEQVLQNAKTFFPKIK